ncbi:hypothetical protein [Sphingomonas prati]|uniref:hypothetical protein n=1 Tax=Sphingomonas prati TaxID=1843237 RepID=UPI001667CAD2|nr:hypothetical protein [Sphingomonas prati]
MFARIDFPSAKEWMTMNVIRIGCALNKRPLLPIRAQERTDRDPPIPDIQYRVAKAGVEQTVRKI